MPAAFSTAGNGELVNDAPVDNGNGTRTWNWKLTYPMASYLSTSSVGLFDYSQYVGATAKGATGAPLKLYDFIETALPANTKTTNNTNRLRQDAIVKYMEDMIGTPYPFLLARRRRAPLAGRLRARVPDQVALRLGLDRHRHARARDRAPVVRRQRRPGHLA